MCNAARPWSVNVVTSKPFVWTGWKVLALLIAASIVVLTMVIAGCATTSLPSGATSLEKRVALCADAKTGLLTAETMLLDGAVLGPAGMAYWTAFEAGCRIAIDSYCGDESK